MSQLAASGAYVATAAAGYPIIVVVQSTRFTMSAAIEHPLADDGQGKCEGALVYRYHGWRYAFDGRPMSARDFGPAAHFEARDYALRGLVCATWRGFVLVNKRNLDAGIPRQDGFRRNTKGRRRVQTERRTAMGES